MHPSPAFHETDPGSLAALVADRGLALVMGVAGGRILLAHAPVLLAEGRLRFHLSGANALGEALSAPGARAVAVVTGADAYVSPDWYAAADQVPTWNYVSAEMEGPVRALGREEAAILLDDLSAHFEAALAPKPPWTRAKMTPGRFETMLGAIRAFEMTLERFEGVTKLSQNKPPDEARRVAEALAARADPASQAVARLMGPRAQSTMTIVGIDRSPDRPPN